MDKKTALAIVSVFLLICAVGCKFSRQAQKSSTTATSSTASDSSATSSSKTDKSETDEWSKETETQYASGQAQDSVGNVYNYYYPTKIIERASGRKQKNYLQTDTTGTHVKKAATDSTATLASSSKGKASGFNQFYILLIVAGAAAVLLASVWVKNNFTVSRKTII